MELINNIIVAVTIFAAGAAMIEHYELKSIQNEH